MEKLIHKAYASADVVASAGMSAGLTSTPLWVGGLTDILQVITLIVGIAVGVSAWRLNRIRIHKLEDGDE